MDKLFSNLAEYPDAKPRRTICPYCKRGLWITGDGKIVCKKCGEVP